jgi:hypothetical protein
MDWAQLFLIINAVPAETKIFTCIPCNVYWANDDICWCCGINGKLITVSSGGQDSVAE